MTGFYLKLYGVVLLAFLLIDGIWLGLVARGFYQKQLGHLLRPDPNWLAAAGFYLFFLVGVLVFAVVPGLQAGSLMRALVLGGLLGFLCYGTYDLTNLATLKGWPLTVVVVDLIWGTLLTGMVSGIGYLAGQWISGSVSAA